MENTFVSEWKHFLREHNVEVLPSSPKQDGEGT